MAIRLRKKDGTWIALCAAKYPKEVGDLYIDDNQDAALRLKFKRDYTSEGLKMVGLNNDFFKPNPKTGKKAKKAKK